MLNQSWVALMKICSEDHGTDNVGHPRPGGIPLFRPYRFGVGLKDMKMIGGVMNYK